MSRDATLPPAVRFTRVRKSFGETVAVDGVSFDVAAGEFFSILGPSGCGKTTTLRMLAGFERPDAGEILLNGARIDGLPPWERPLAMVFQSYALFPHLSVARNVAFGLERRKLPRAEIDDRVRSALELVRLDPGIFGRRSPRQLSGGQRQRIALARALVLEPPVLLLDEPLGALDRKLRKEMQGELRALNRELGTTFVYVTHDQEEALAMSDRVAVMAAARIEQVGTPAEVYERPRTAFVAGFLGETNIFEADDGRRVALRPERARLLLAGSAVPAGLSSRPGEIRDLVYLGDREHAIVGLRAGADFRVDLRNTDQAEGRAWKRGDAVIVAWRPDDAHPLEDG